MIHHDHQNECPECGVKTDAVSGLTVEEMPKPGDVSICPYCAVVSVFGDDLALRRPTPEEWHRIDEDVFVQRALDLVRKSALFGTRRG